LNIDTLVYGMKHNIQAGGQIAMFVVRKNDAMTQNVRCDFTVSKNV